MASRAPHNSRATTEDVWRDFGSSLQQFVGRRVNSPDDTDEIVQEIFLRLHANIDKIEQPAGWIYSVARNSITDFYRSARYRRERSSSDAIESLLEPEIMADNEDVWAEFVRCVEPLLNSLNETDRAAVSLIDLQGRTQVAVAEELGLSVSGMKSRVQRARRKMLRALG